MITRHIPRHIRTVIWDFNGTLLDDVEHCVDIINVLLQEHGLSPIDRARYHEVFDFPVRRYYERLGFDLDDAAWRRIAARFIEAYDAGVARCRLHDGVVEALEGLSGAGVAHAVLSAARQHSVEDALEVLGVRHHFFDIVGLKHHYAHGKEELGVEWIRASALRPDETMLIGDTTHDFEVARAIGVPCVLVAAGHHSRQRLEQCGCPVIDSLAEL